MNTIERQIFCSPGGKFREFEGITTHVEPADRALYRQLLPTALSMPAQPVVTLFVVDYVCLVPWPMTRYQEWSVLLKCALNGEEGWFSLSMPVTRWLAMVTGRHIGFPKYLADEITVQRKGDRMVGRARHKGVQQIELEFTPGLTRSLTAWEKELIDEPSFFKRGRNFQLVPPGRGPRLLGITLEHVVEPHWSPCPGMAKLTVDPSESWAGLVPAWVAYPGTTNHFIGGMNITFQDAALATGS